MPSTESRLFKAYKKAEVLPFDETSRFILMSDCHRGQGNTGDNFLPNQTVYFGALEYYYEQGFTYIEIGDGDELWENRSMKPIVEVHSDAFWMLSGFYREGRYRMLYGNHDMIKKKKSYLNRSCSKYYCESSGCELPLFPDITASEGLILENRKKGERLFLVHGHQGDLLNDTLWPLARFLVRYVWRPLEMIGFIDPTGAGRPREKREKIERKLSGFAEHTGQILVAGHTHRPVFSKPGEGLYFNDGSCVHPRCITGIEIDRGKIALVKWAVMTRADRSLYVGREVLEGPVPLADYYTHTS